MRRNVVQATFVARIGHEILRALSDLGRREVGFHPVEQRGDLSDLVGLRHDLGGEEELRFIDQSLSVAALIPALVRGLPDLRVGVGEVALSLRFRRHVRVPVAELKISSVSSIRRSVLSQTAGRVATPFALVVRRDRTAVELPHGSPQEVNQRPFRQPVLRRRRQQPATPATSSCSQPTSLTTPYIRSLDSEKSSGSIAASVADDQDRLLG